MDDAASGGHAEIDRPRADGLHVAEAVAMDDLAVKQIGDRGEPDVRMRTHIHAVARCHLHGPEMVQEDERPDAAFGAGGQEPAHNEIAKIGLPSSDVGGEFPWLEGSLNSPEATPAAAGSCPCPCASRNQIGQRSSRRSNSVRMSRSARRRTSAVRAGDGEAAKASLAGASPRTSSLRR